MQKNIVNMGLIGCGWISENAHIPSLLKIEGVIVKSVFDISIERAKRLADAFNIKNYFDKIEMFFNSGIDAVIIATPNYTHVDYSLQALRHGIHVLCEKPIAFSSKDMNEIIKVSKKNQVLFVPGFVNRWRQDIKRIQEFILSDKIGDIKKIDAGWLRKNGIPRPGTWFTNKDLSGGGALIDLGSHIADICLMFLGDKKYVDYSLTISQINNMTKEANAADWFQSRSSAGLSADVEDTAYASIKFENEIILNLTLSWSFPVSGDCTYINIIGTHGSLRLKTLFGFSRDRLWKDDSLIYHDGESIHTVTQSDRKLNNTENAFCDMLRDFTSKIKGNHISIPDVYDALKVVNLIENLYNVQNLDFNAIKNIDLGEVLHG
jgi:predicted dehydrogenase